MRRRLVYLASGLTLIITGIFAYVAPEARFACATLAGFAVLTTWWVARRLPARRMLNREALGLAGTALLLGVGLAVWIPSSRIACDCPPPPGATGGVICLCPMDQHLPLRIAVLALGVVIAMSLLVAVRVTRRARVRLPEGKAT
jgi:hypothetical protein